jgi:CheY-like chemotaxis protein
MEFDQTLAYVQDLARLRKEGRAMRRRIEARGELRLVLVADDEPFTRALLSATLSPENYEVIEASTGAEALDLIRAHHPTLVVLDARMPEPNGFVICKHIKSDPALQDIRVIMVTGDPDDETQAQAAGADRYLSKPFSPLELLKTIEVLLAGR